MPYDQGLYDAAVGYDSSPAGAGFPTASLSVNPATGVAPIAVTANASGSTAGTNPIASYTFAWGDGTPNTGPSGVSVPPAHTYAANGNWLITLTVTDTQGNASTATALVRLSNVIPPSSTPPPTGFRPDEPPSWSLVDPPPPCTSSTVYGVQLSWTVPTLNGGVFVAFHVERADDSQGWHEIARITNLSILTFTDYEARSNVLAQWRMRVEIDSGFGEYSDPTVEVVPLCCGYSLTSNEDPTLNLARIDIGTRKYEWPEEPAAQIWPLHSRADVVVFRSVEDRGDKFDISLLLYGANPAFAPPNAGRQAGEVVRRMLNANISYVCVRDETGTRWFAALLAKSPSLTRNEPGGIYLADLTVREVSAYPSVVDVAA